jgi:hypothetical protein
LIEVMCAGHRGGNSGKEVEHPLSNMLHMLHLSTLNPAVVLA